MFLTQLGDGQNYCNLILESLDGCEGRWTRGKFVYHLNGSCILQICDWSGSFDRALRFRKRQETISWTRVMDLTSYRGSVSQWFPSGFAGFTPLSIGSHGTLPKFGNHDVITCFSVPSQRHLHDIFCQLHPILIVPVGLADLRGLWSLRKGLRKPEKADELRKPMMFGWTPHFGFLLGSEFCYEYRIFFPSLHQSVAERSPELQPGFNSAFNVAMAKLVYILAWVTIPEIRRPLPSLGLGEAAPGIALGVRHGPVPALASKARNLSKFL